MKKFPSDDEYQDTFTFVLWTILLAVLGAILGIIWLVS